MPHCLGSGLTCRLGLGGHRSLQLDGKTGILAAKQRFIISHESAATTERAEKAFKAAVVGNLTFLLVPP